MDLLVLVVGSNDISAIEGILAEYQRLGTRRIESQVQARRGWCDADVLRRCHDFLRPQQKLADFALVVFDREGCGRIEPIETLEKEVETRLASNGWANRSAAVVIDPELEAWVWSDSPHVETTLRWTKGRARLEEWLVQKGYRHPDQQKPHQPKEAVEALLRISKTPRTSSIYRELAKHVSFQRCTDPAFLKLRHVLKRWFPPEGSQENLDQ